MKIIIQRLTFTHILNLRKSFSRQVAHQVVPFLSNNISGFPVWAEGQPGVSPSLSTCPRRPRLLPLRPVSVRGPIEGQDGHQRDHQHPEGLAAGAPEEPLPHKGREDNACYHHQDDPYTGRFQRNIIVLRELWMGISWNLVSHNQFLVTLNDLSIIVFTLLISQFILHLHTFFFSMIPSIWCFALSLPCPLVTLI